MLGIVIDLLLTAIFLKIIASVLPDLEIDGFGPALITAVVMTVVGTAVGFAMAPFIAPWLAAGVWVSYAFGFVVSVIILMIALNVVPGVRVESASSVVVAALLLSALRIGTSFVMRMVDVPSLLKT
jgi:putative membrane protein